MIRGIIGSPNMVYKCLHMAQSYYTCYFCKNNLLEVAEKTKWPILFMEDCSTDEMDGLMVVTLKPRMYNSREHLVLWGCLWMSLNTHPKSEFHAHLILQVCISFTNICHLPKLFLNLNNHRLMFNGQVYAVQCDKTAIGG